MSRYESIAQKTVWLSKKTISKQYCLWRHTVTLKYPGATNSWDDVTSVKFNSKKSNLVPRLFYCAPYCPLGQREHRKMPGYEEAKSLRRSNFRPVRYITIFFTSIESLQICQSPDSQYKEEHPIEYKIIKSAYSQPWWNHK